MSELKSKLLGRRVLSLLMNPEHDYMRFVTDAGVFDFHCYGDCCSESFINHTNCLEDLLGNTVLEVDEVDMFSALGVVPEPTRQEVDQVLTYRLRTSKGICALEFRNSSNGYYGGSLEYVGESDYRHYSALIEQLKPITEDF